jgi:hypothetical protein
MSYQTALSGLDWSMVPSGMTVPPAGISAMTQYEGGMASILAGNNIGYITANISSGNYTGTINDVVYDTIVVSGTASANRTITLYTDSNNGHKKYQVYIPATCLVASSGGPYTLTITTGSGNSVYIPIAAQGSLILSSSLLFNIYVDSSGNVTSNYTSENYAQSLYNNVMSTTTTSFTDIPGFYVNFTPRSSKVRISYNVVCGMNGAISGYIRVVVNGSFPYIGITASGYTPVGSGDYYDGSTDSNTSKQSTTTFIMPCTPNQLLNVKIQWSSPQGGTMYLNTLGSNISNQLYSCRAISSILVEEVW